MAHLLAKETIFPGTKHQVFKLVSGGNPAAAVFCVYAGTWNSGPGTLKPEDYDLNQAFLCGRRKPGFDIGSRGNGENISSLIIVLTLRQS